jgi:hypothetical protein
MTGAPQLLPPPPSFLRAEELERPADTTLIHMPLYSPYPGVRCVTRAVLWDVPKAERNSRRVYALLRQLYQRRLLHPNVLLIARLPDGIVLGVDMPDPERLAAYAAAVDRLAWAWKPWLISVAPFDDCLMRLADSLNLGVRHDDDVFAGGAL